MPLSFAFERNLSTEHAVHDDEIDEGQAHADCPPSKPDVQGVWFREGLLDSDVVFGVAPALSLIKLKCSGDNGFYFHWFTI